MILNRILRAIFLDIKSFFLFSEWTFSLQSVNLYSEGHPLEKNPQNGHTLLLMGR
jgi:hypothetical protein